MKMAHLLLRTPCALHDSLLNELFGAVQEFHLMVLNFVRLRTEDLKVRLGGWAHMNHQIRLFALISIPENY